MKKKLVVYGGGSSAHTLIPLLSKANFEVSVLTSRPSEWGSVLHLEYRTPTGSVLQRFEGPVDRVTDKAELCIPTADYIVLCMPVHKYRIALHSIAPYISKEKNVCVGTIYGQGGFNWMVDEIKDKFHLPKVVTFAFGLIPWICRITKYGHSGVIYGPKVVNAAVVSPRHYFKQIDEELLEPICYDWFHVGKVEQLENFISITMAVDNQIIHPSRCYALYHKYGSTWDKLEDVPMFYKDYDDFSAECLQALDDDYSKIRQKIRCLYPNKDFHYMLNYMDLEHYTYHSKSTDIVDSFVNSPTLQAIGTPVVAIDSGEIELDKNCRFFMDDIYYGIAIAKWIAQLLDINVPMIDKILHWVQELRHERIISDDNKLLLDSIDLAAPMKTGIPFVYGKTTIDELVD